MTEHLTSHMKGQSGFEGDTRWPCRIQSDAVNPFWVLVCVLGPTIGSMFDKSRFFAYCIDMPDAVRSTGHCVYAQDFASEFSKAAHSQD